MLASVHTLYQMTTATVTHTETMRTVRMEIDIPAPVHLALKIESAIQSKPMKELVVEVLEKSFKGKQEAKK